MRRAAKPHLPVIGALHRPALARAVFQVFLMVDASPTEYFIQGITKSGKKFRPSDWSERLCGVMSSFGPGASGPNARLKYSLYVRPVILGDVKTVIVDSRLRDIEPMAFDFVMNFARDNDLLVTEACEIPAEHPTRQREEEEPKRKVG
jgi:Protein of unknown function (DUF3579)